MVVRMVYGVTNAIVNVLVIVLSALTTAIIVDIHAHLVKLVNMDRSIVQVTAPRPVQHVPLTAVIMVAHAHDVQIIPNMVITVLRHVLLIASVVNVI